MKFNQLLMSLVMLCLVSVALTGQVRNCSTMDYLDIQKENDPKMEYKMQDIEKQTQHFVDNPQNKAVNGVITIPVVVHVIYGNSTENISDAQIASQMQVLNDDFRRLNSDADNTWSQAADTEIEFCMATVDPNGNATNGITRTSTSVSAFSTNDAMKYTSQGGKDAWPAGDYLNMWVCDISGGILGYAQFPGGGPATDGVVMDYQYFGTIGTATAPFDLGRTTTHEVGHWLNLRHIWGDGNCSADDFVSDTPTSDAANYGCATGHVSCNSTDMVQNYMDYSDDGCMNLFTAGQTSRMRALFEPGGFRASLLNSTACGSTGPTPTCSDNIQNQGETGVDCGGPCPACNCNDNSVTVTITLDNYPEETAWTLTDASGITVASGGTYANQADGSTVTIPLCIPNGCYDFNITDTYGDGICCSYGNGAYSVTGAGGVLASGGQFTTSETTNFCLGTTAPTCSDGIQNQGETGVDCGGPCAACPTCNDGIQNQGETGVDCGGPCTACPTCNDGIQNQGETGVDCGGPCTACTSCNDGIQNQGETGVDCGGPCPNACPTCNDGIQNQGETDVDCGGPCAACATCFDGIQNQGETGVDCGGPCTPCNNGCNFNTVTITITFDNYPEETSWNVYDSQGNSIGAGGPYGSQPDGSTASWDACWADGCYEFVIQDSYGDGICCGYGNGSYTVTNGPVLLASGSAFGTGERTTFCLGNVAPPATCTDGIQNQGETGVDCGGPCAPCNTPCTWALIDKADFEGGWGIWNDGGADCRRSANDASYANSGNYCVRLRDNTSTSVTSTDLLDLTGYDDIAVDFTYITRSMDNSNEDFWFQISSNGGLSYTTVEEWNLGDEFQNGVREYDQVLVNGPFTNSMRLRFRCDASSNADWVYIDDVTIYGCANGTKLDPNYVAPEIIEEAVIENNSITTTTPKTAFEGALNIFPNPAQDFLNVNIELEKASDVQILVTDVSGKIVKQQSLQGILGTQKLRVETIDLPAGIFFIHMVTDTEKISKKFVVTK